MDPKDELIEQLKEENQYLRSLLSSHGIVFNHPKIIEHYELSTDDKINSYLSYFVGRDDIFAYQYINKEGKKQFSPACKARPNLTGYCLNKCSECLNKQYVGITEAEIKRHLIGHDTFGIYPLLKSDVCKLLAVDFDDEDFKESAIALFTPLHHFHVLFRHFCLCSVCIKNIVSSQLS